jgi:predicted MPP superfamily phosphohydrolase
LEPHWLKITHLEISSADIPLSFDNKKIVFVSDIHHGPFFSIERVTNLVNEINKLEPDIVLLGGDYSHRDTKFVVPVFDELKKLKAKLGIYAVRGNHDHWEGAELTKLMIKRSGFMFCDNASFWVKVGNDSIKIGGVGDLWMDHQLIDSTTHDLKPSDYCILLSHNPDYIEKIPDSLIDVTFSGHSHGGQVTLFGLWAPILPSEFGQKYRYGLHNKEKMQYYITSGIGTITPPLRFFCRPEIVLITLKRP